MKVAVTATGPSLDAAMDPRFGRCSYFVLVETDDMTFEAIENANSSLGGGAGIQSAQLMAQKGVKAVLTGNCGPNAHQTLSAAGIDVFVGCSGTVSEAVERFKSGQLRPLLHRTSQPLGHGRRTAMTSGRRGGWGGGMGMHGCGWPMPERGAVARRSAAQREVHG